MLLRLCQLKSQLLIGMILINLGSCSWHSNSGQSSSELVSTFPNKWFSADINHSLISPAGEAMPHMIFDATPEFSQTNQTVNAIITTPAKSAQAYQIDLYSGQRFFSHSYCKQKDVWNNFSGSINTPSFSIGVIPRVLDQLGEPQKIIIWSNRKDYGQSQDLNYFKVRIIGAYVEQNCPEGNCLGKSNWLSRLVFIGVDSEDSSLSLVTDLTSFQKVVKWDEMKAQLENIDGRNFIGDQTYAYTRVGQLIEYGEAFNYFKKRSIFLTDAELKKIQKGCHNLYNGLWENVGEWRPEDKPAKTTEELNQKLKRKEELRKNKMPTGFAERLRIFTKKYYNEISTCERFVYHGNINEDPERFWFYSYMGIFFRLHKEGYAFDCRQKSWQRNVLNSEGKPVHDIKRDIIDCNDRDIDLAMAYLPNFLTSLKGENEYFRFIDYDNHVYGTHKKMYSWIKIKPKKFACGLDPNEKIKTEMRVFPEDVAWKERNVKDLASDMKIIY